MRISKENWLKIVGKEPANLDELFEGVIHVLNHTLAAQEHSKGRNYVVGLKWDVRYSSTVSNSHSAPLSGRMNWGRKDAKVPSSYPGFTGRVWVRYKHEPNSFGSDPFGLTLTHTGTGGYGSYDGPWSNISKAYYCADGKLKSKAYEPACYSWDFRFFLDDFPLIKRRIEKQETLEAIRGNQAVIYHDKLWEDPDTAAQDEKLIQLVNA